jgi:hypothetical protein
VISLETARQLLDFAGGGPDSASRVSERQARDQLEGTVAIHNILEQHRVAYLADEVGMGKTYVALGAFALFRHFNPAFRMLVIAPKENIQRKWTKELRNFVRNNVTFADQRVKAVHGAPARPPVICENLLHLVRETTLDPDRDFFARLTSFSFGLGKDDTGWRQKRDRLLAMLPWLDPDLFKLHSKDAFKENFARAVCCALPVFDLVIIDEAHNLKGGLTSKASRNRVLTLAMGRELPGAGKAASGFKQFGPRARRVLLLSATPLEDDYRHVWNQLACFGLEDVVAGLEDSDKDEEAKKGILSKILIRRVNAVHVVDQRLTKNQYRREWRGGGVEVHDEPLSAADERQQLVVALVQKKVSELLSSERFNNSFQVGMLASFESFLRTAGVKDSEDSTFDDAEQTDDAAEREGIDVNAVNSLARSYWNRFGRELPHPKMDALVRTLRDSFATGEKALVFVRRVASVRELQQKLETEYDDWLMARLRVEVRAELREQLEARFEAYHRERREKTQVEEPASPSPADEADDDTEPVRPDDANQGGNETFFAWFFRGEGPPGTLSGAELSYRLNTPRYALASFFLDNWVATLLDVPPEGVLDALRKALGTTESELRTDLEQAAGRVTPLRSRLPHEELFMAFQHAALSLLAAHRGALGSRAQVVLEELFDMPVVASRSIPLGDWVGTATFFTELRKRPSLRDALWPTERPDHFRAMFRRSELRRELIASMFRLGHSLIDLWVLYVNHVGRLEARAAERTEHNARELAAAVLGMLETQRGASGLTAWSELRDAASHFDLIVDTNLSSLWDRRLTEATNEIGKVLREQQPVGGMSGTVNGTLVRQFRMPGYPLVLVTTDLLQEGEDLHLFCSRVYHYGISWMPSSLEQRIGRIDRVRSQTERRLMSAESAPGGPDLLQVYYPYLRETVEVFQVARVFERLNRFIRLMHESFGGAEDEGERKIDIQFEAQRGFRLIVPITESLKSSFPVRRELIAGPRTSLPVDRRSEANILQRFYELERRLAERMTIEWRQRAAPNALVGSLIAPRQQPFTLLLHSIEGRLNVRCVSPVGRVDPRTDTERIAREARSLPARIGAVYDPRFKQYDLTVEGDVLLNDPALDADRVQWLVSSVSGAADRLEEILLAIDRDAVEFAEDLQREADFER